MSASSAEPGTAVAVVERATAAPPTSASSSMAEGLVVTSRAGANRVFEAGDERFVRPVDPNMVVDTAGREWRVTEEALVLADDPRVARLRVPAQRAFWFGWRAQFPDTLLIK